MNDERRFYVYAHLEADTGRIFYIGKGSKTRAFYPRYENKLWRAIADAHGFRAIILADGLFEKEAYALEAVLTRAFDRGVLATQALGGAGAGGVPKTEANRAAISARMKERNPTRLADVRRRLSEAKRGKPNSPEARAKISVALRGRKRGPMPPQVAAALEAVRKRRSVITACGLRFESTLAAAKALGVHQGNIVNNCAGRAKSAGGYSWSYAT